MDAVVVSYITNVELELVTIQRDAHVLLLFLIAAENPDFGNIGMQEALENRVTEGARAPGNQQSLVFKHKIHPKYSRKIVHILNQLRP